MGRIGGGRKDLCRRGSRTRSRRRSRTGRTVCRRNLQLKTQNENLHGTWYPYRQWHCWCWNSVRCIWMWTSLHLNIVVVVIVVVVAAVVVVVVVVVCCILTAEATYPARVVPGRDIAFFAEWRRSRKSMNELEIRKLQLLSPNCWEWSPGGGQRRRRSHTENSCCSDSVRCE